MNSVSVICKPSDSRCRYWALKCRADQALPAPQDLYGAESLRKALPQAWLKGDTELFAGEFIFVGEENHHRKTRGWSYALWWVDAAGNLVGRTPNTDTKLKLKAAGIDPQLLRGSGDVAAMVRLAHGIRAGLVDAAKINACVYENADGKCI